MNLFVVIVVPLEGRPRGFEVPLRDALRFSQAESLHEEQSQPGWLVPEDHEPMPLWTWFMRNPREGGPA